ncbi:MAG: hypothetical protein JWO82_3367 [Akkermansiaceae bacterium]|nr:hypothetical protein [Akkermansiaceae bacterium]
MLMSLLSSSEAASPQLINFQGIARRADGSPIASATVKLRLSIRQGTASGAVIYQETDSLTTSPGGQFAIQIGAGSVVVGSLQLIAWQTGAYFLQTEIDPAGGSSYVDMGTQQMVSVPYALQSHLSDLTTAVTGTSNRVAIFGAGGNTLTDSNIYYSGGFIGIGDSSPSYVLDVSGSVRGLTIRSQGNVVAINDVSGDTGTFASAATVGGFGLIHGTDGTQQRIYTREAGFSVTGLGPGSTLDSTIGFSGFANPPKVMVGNLTTGTGDFAKVMMTLFDSTAGGCKVRFYNPGSSSITLTGTWQIICIGN